MKHACLRIVVILLVTSLAGCIDSDNNNDNSGSQASFRADLTAVEVANTDTGERIEVGGLPVASDTLVKE